MQLMMMIQVVEKRKARRAALTTEHRNVSLQSHCGEHLNYLYYLSNKIFELQRQQRFRWVSQFG